MRRESRQRAALATLAGTGTTVTITVVQAFVLIPLCLQYLGTPLYGAWLAATEIFVWIQLLDVGIPNLMTQRVGAAVGNGDAVAARRWAATGLVGLALIGILLLVAGLLAAPAITAWARVPVEHAAVFVACFRSGVLASALLLAFNGCVGLARGVQRTAAVSAGQVVGATSGLVVSVVLLLDGWGLWALAIGLLTRAVIGLAAAAIFLASLPRTDGRWLGRPSRAVAREAAGLVPSMAGASVGYLLANNSEILLVTTLFGPIPAAVYALTRRAIDGLRSLLDSVAWAVYGGFAHLVSAEDRHRARSVLGDILGLRLAIACLVGAVAASVNQTFVTLLFGPDTFGGVWLTTAFVVQMVLGGQAFLANFLYRASGSVRDGSLLLAAEALARVAAMSIGLGLIGLAGAPAAAAGVSALALLITLRRLGRVLPPSGRPVDRPARLQGTAVSVLAGGIFLGASWMPQTWPAVAATAALVALAGGLVLWWSLGRGRQETLLRWVRP